MSSSTSWSSWSSWSPWIPILIHSITSIISIHFLFKFCANIARNVERYTKAESMYDRSISNKETLCERCAIIVASSAVKKNYHNKNNQIKNKTFDDESYQRCVDGDGDGVRLGGSSDDDDDVVGQVSTREVISYDRPGDNKKIFEVCHRKNSVSMLRKQFENVDDKKTIRNFERQISEKFFKRATSPIRTTTVREEVGSAESATPATNDYYVIEKTKVYKVMNNNSKENVKGAEATAVGPEKISKLILSTRSLSNGDIKRLKRSPSHGVIAEDEEPIALTERTRSVEQMNEDFDDIEYRKISTANDRRSVRTVDDILQQERFSKCYSEYSISDLLNDLPDDDDSEFTSFFNKIK